MSNSTASVRNGSEALAGVHEAAPLSLAGREVDDPGCFPPSSPRDLDQPVLNVRPDENAIRWLAWSDEAFVLARRLDRPVLLSVVHAASPWCRLMDEESYQDPEIAAELNRSFVCIRIDAEDRPDLAVVFRTVTRLVSGAGDWPLTVALTPDRKPFHAATYVPRVGLFDLPGFQELITSLAAAWRGERDEVETRAEHLASSLEMVHEGGSSHDSEVDTLEDAYSTLWYQFEPERGGFGPAGRLPSASALAFLLRYWKRTGNEQALEMVETTLHHLRLGAVYDQIGFGFHHRCADDQWRHPWFHKTVYDQALMAMVYVESFQATGKEEYADTAHELFTYLLCDLSNDDGVFTTSEEGADTADGTSPYYQWTPAEVRRTLGRELGDLFCRVFRIAEGEDYTDPVSGEPSGRCVPHLRRPVAEVAEELGLHEATLRRRLQASCTELFIAREERTPPRKDTRIRTAYNGLAIAALAKGAAALDEPTYAAAAEKAAEWLLLELRDAAGGLYRRFDDDGPAQAALLDDYAYLVWGLIELYEASFEPRHLRRAMELSDAMIERFWDEERGSLFLSPRGATDLPLKPLDLEDDATPSAAAVATANLARLSRLTAVDSYENVARTVVETCWSQVARSPARYPQMLVAHELLSSPSVQVVVAGDPDSPEGEDMIGALRSGFHPALQVLARPDRPFQHPITELATFTEFQVSQANRPTAYVCSGFCCASPTNDIDQMLIDLERAGV